jgi:hypothetical protein
MTDCSDLRLGPRSVVGIVGFEGVVGVVRDLDPR